jgi:hypothetical protein
VARIACTPCCFALSTIEAMCEHVGQLPPAALPSRIDIVGSPRTATSPDAGPLRRCSLGNRGEIDDLGYSPSDPTNPEQLH